MRFLGFLGVAWASMLLAAVAMNASTCIDRLGHLCEEHSDACSDEWIRARCAATCKLCTDETGAVAKGGSTLKLRLGSSRQTTLSPDYCRDIGEEAIQRYGRHAIRNWVRHWIDPMPDRMSNRMPTSCCPVALMP